MEARGRRSIIAKFLSLGIPLAFAACSTAPVSQTPNPAESASPLPGPIGVLAPSPLPSSSPEPSPTPSDSPSPSPTPTETASYGPEPVQLRPIILVLGPGYARGFAHAGVLRALEEAKIPIGAVVGTEMGALIGGLYAASETINRFDWALMKFRNEAFYHPKDDLFSSLTNQVSDGALLKETLAQVLSNKEIQATRLPYRVYLTKTEPKLDLIQVSQGNLASALRASMAIPNVMEPGSWESGRAISAGSRKPFPVTESRVLGTGPVVLVDVMDEADTAVVPLKPGNPSVPEAMNRYIQSARNAGKAEVKSADWVIRPDLKGISHLDFQKRTEIEFRGKSATQKDIEQIKRLVGIARDPAGARP